MSTTKKGRAYEDLIEKILRLVSHKNEYNSVERNVRLDSKHGKREVDILLTKRGSIFDSRVIVECKDQRAKVRIGVVSQLHDTREDLGANKAILVSRSGFSSRAVSKAREKGITLLKADELAGDDFHYIPEIPILLKQVRVKKESTNFLFDLNKNENHLMLPDGTRMLQVNDKSIFEWLRDKWNSEDIDFESPGVKFLDFPEIADKYVRSKTGYKMLLDNFSIQVETVFQYYFGFIRVNEGGYIVEKVLSGQRDIILPFNESLGLESRLKKIKLHDLPRMDKIHIYALIKEYL